MQFATNTETGHRVAALRERAGETQAQLGVLLDIPQPAISKIERGERGLTGRELAVLAQHFAVPNAALVEREDTLLALRDAKASPDRARDAIATFHGYVDFHFGVQALTS